jgi:glycosyltransferase involved in cell wall biosynthesis
LGPLTEERAAPVTVLRIIDRLNVGGPAIHAVLATSGLDRRKFRTVLVIGSVEPGEADMSYLLEQHGIEAVIIPSLGRELRPLRDLRTALQLYRVVRRVRPTIVHTHKAKAGALGRIVSIVARVPVRVHTFHGHVFHGYFRPWKTSAFLLIEQALSRATTKLVALSERLVAELADKYRVAPRSRFAIVPLGFDLRAFAAADAHRGELRRELGLDATVPLVGIVGRMVPVKDHATFVSAAALLAARRPDVHFVMVGGGELEAQVRAAVVASGIADRTHLLGWRRDLDRIYPDFDVVALSSVNEGTPVSLIEAMACGVPVVSTAVGGVPDVLKDGQRGELSPSGDPPALALAIERGLGPTAKERAKRARAEILAEFGGERLCTDLAELYQRLLEDRGKKQPS